MAGRPLRRERIARENGRFATLPVYAVSVVVKRDPWEMLPEDEPTFSVTYHVQTDKGVDAAEMLGTSRARQEYGADRVLDAEAVPAADPARRARENGAAELRKRYAEREENRKREEIQRVLEVGGDPRRIHHSDADVRAELLHVMHYIVSKVQDGTLNVREVGKRLYPGKRASSDIMLDFQQYLSDAGAYK